MPEYAKSMVMSGVKLSNTLYIYNGRYRVQFTSGPSVDGDGWRWTDNESDAHGTWCDSMRAALKELAITLDRPVITASQSPVFP